MSRNISAAVYEKHGNPADVLHVETRPWPTPAADEAVVKMRAAPINPADLNQIEGKYPVRPELPATPGTGLSAQQPQALPQPQAVNPETGIK